MNRWLRLGAQAVSNPRRFARRLQNEVLAPSGPLAGAARAAYCKVVPNRTPWSHGNQERLLFVYDSLPNPVTYDFIHYMYYADWLRGELGKEYVDVLLVTRKNVAASREERYIAAIGDDNMEWRVANVIIPLCRLFASLGRLYVVDQEEAFELVKGYRHVHPRGYAYGSPHSAACRLDEPGFAFRPTLTVSGTAKAVVEAYFQTDARRLVTITLRNYGYLAKRNSNIAAWVQFAKALDPARYRPVFIPDASMHGVATLGDLSDCEVFDPACWNVELRAAVYQRAWMNMGVVCGPLSISCLMDGVTTVMLYNSSSFPADYLKAYHDETGLVPGERPQFYSPTCRFFHGSDDRVTIQRAFDEYAA
jgi:hypothetical protein